MIRNQPELDVEHPKTDTAKQTNKTHTCTQQRPPTQSKKSPTELLALLDASLTLDALQAKLVPVRRERRGSEKRVSAKEGTKTIHHSHTHITARRRARRGSTLGGGTRRATKEAECAQKQSPHRRNRTRTPVVAPPPTRIPVLANRMHTLRVVDALAAVWAFRVSAAKLHGNLFEMRD
jgi:hypothetical protein